MRERVRTELQNISFTIYTDREKVINVHIGTIIFLSEQRKDVVDAENNSIFNINYFILSVLTRVNLR